MVVITKDRQTNRMTNIYFKSILKGQVLLTKSLLVLHNHPLPIFKTWEVLVNDRPPTRIRW